MEKAAIDNKYHFCKETEETVDHLVKCYKKIIQTSYKQQHEKVATMVYWDIWLIYYISIAAHLTRNDSGSFTAKI